MDVASKASLLNGSAFITSPKRPAFLLLRNQHITLSSRSFPANLHFSSRYLTNSIRLFDDRGRYRSVVAKESDVYGVEGLITSANSGFWEVFLKRGFLLAATVFGVLVFWSRGVFASEGVVSAGHGFTGQSIFLLKGSWPKALQVLRVFKEQGLVLAALLGLSAFFSMAETSITTLWPWKV